MLCGAPVASAARRGGMDISVVIPVYNEVDALPELHRALADYANARALTREKRATALQQALLRPAASG